MRKTLFVLVFLIIVGLMMSVPVMATGESKAPEYKMVDGEEYFFANGTPIIIKEDTENPDGAIITWGVDGSQKITGPLSNIFGGTHNDDSISVNSSITIEGGYIAYIHGGGLHRSNTKTSTIIMNGGQVGMIKGGGATYWTTSGDCGCTNSEDMKWKDSDYENSPCQTGESNVIINSGKIEYKNSTVVAGALSESKGKVYGGGNGYANTEIANVTINGGDMSNAYVTGAGANGNTTTVNMNITGGTIDIVQSVNRGTVETATVVVAGGTIDNFYVGGESPAPAGDTVNATITEKVNVGIAGTAKVNNMSLGSNGKNALTVSNDASSVLTPEDIIVVEGTVLTNNIAKENMIVAHHIVIDNELYMVKTGETIDKIEGNKTYSEVIKKDGYKFVGFQTENGTEWDATKKIDSDLILKTVFEEIQKEKDNETTEKENKEELKDRTPKTGEETMILPIFTLVAVVSLVGIVINRKK